MSTVSVDRLGEVRAFVASGRRDIAEQACEALVLHHPEEAAPRAFLAALQLDRGATAAAIANLQAAAALAPDDTGILLQLAVARFRKGDRDAARATLEALLAVQPGHVSGAFHLALLCEDSRDAVEAERLYAVALAGEPGHREARLRLGGLLRRLGRNAEAFACLQPLWRPEAPDPALAEALACTALDAGDARVAADMASVATRLAPQRVDAWLAFGLALRRLGNAPLAYEAMREVVARHPGHALAWCELAIDALDLGDGEAAREAFAHAQSLAPDWLARRWIDALALPALVDSEHDSTTWLTRFSTGLDTLHATLEADARDPASLADAVARVVPFRLHYHAADTTALTWHYGDLVARAVRAAAPAALKAPLDWTPLAHGGRLRVGFVSCEMREHTITRYFEGWLTDLDRARFEVHAWHLGEASDAVTARIAARADAFHAVAGTGLHEVAAQVRDARLDVLVHVEVGMDSRMQQLAALRLAPVQCAGYGHPVTTGIDTLDVFLSADAMEPADAQDHYRERLVRLPGLGVVPSPTPPAGDAGWLPCAAGRPLLMCLQALFKLEPAFDDAVARIAMATDAVVVFFTAPRALVARFEARLARAFERHGGDARRHVVMVDRRTHADYLAGVAAADLVLDSFGFSGGATSLDTLAAGTPVVTLEGRFARGRQTAAMLRLLGADAELVAHDVEDYVRRAIALCADDGLRSELRGRLRVAAPRLFDAPDVLPALEAFLEQAARDAATPSF